MINKITTTITYWRLALAALWLLLGALPARAQAPPGNALAFDGTNDYVHMTSVLPATGEFTLEGWVNPTAFSGGLDALVLADNFPAGAMHCQFYGNNLGFTINGNNPTDVVSASALPTGRWSHVAVVYSASAKTVKFYVNGVLNTSAAYTTAQPIAATPYSLGGWLNGSVQRPFAGKLDEVRLYNTALTQAQVQADMTSTSAALPASLVAYYDMDQGTAGGANTAQTTLLDRSPSHQDGTLTNFALTSGSVTSNFVESYALVLPTLAAASGVSGTGFTVSWTAPALGIVSGYVLDYSTSPTFAANVTSLSLAAGATSQALSGLLATSRYYYRLRADKASVTGTGAYALGSARTSGPAPPASALAFDGADDYVAVAPNSALDNLGPGDFTLEAWVYYDGGSGAQSIVRKTGDYNLYLNGNTLHAEVWPNGLGDAAWRRADGTTVLPANRWTHVAAVWRSAPATCQLYVNGVADGPGTSASGAIGGTEALYLGYSSIYGNPLSGRLDEVRIYGAALTAAQLRADMTSTSPAVPGSLLLYYNMDQGAASGANAANTTLTDQSPTQADGTLTNFDLSAGNTTSNWVESYALVVPTLAAATGGTATGFTANWAAPALGIVDNGYRLDVATSNTFAAAALVAGSPIVASGTSQAVTGLDPAQTYYYRVRADKASVTGQGAASRPVVRAPFTPLTPPGNALAFDGGDDYVTGTNPQLPQGNTPRSLEAWVLTTASGSNVVVNYGAATSNQRSGILLINGRLYYVGENNDLQGTKVISDGRWHHVAATYDGTTLKLYVDGVLDVSNTPSAFNTTGFDWNIGKRIPPLTSTEQFNGRLDEVRLYSTALTQAQVQADMTSTSPAVPASLVAYYNFDHGTPAGANAGYTTVADQTGNGNAGTLVSFNLSAGNTTSNWVESYALVVPTALAATAAPDGTTLNATWAAPTIGGAAPAAGTVEGYVLDASTSSTFASGVTSYAVAGAGTTSAAATGLANGTTYYLRVRANKASTAVNNQGAYSATFATHTIGTEARLTNLTSAAGALSPAFATGTTAYTLPLRAGQNAFTLVPTASNAYTAIVANGVAVTSGAATASYPAGTLVTLVLTSEDGQATRTYTVQSVNTPDYYRSVASGNWADVSTWEGSDDNATWGAVPFGPSAGSQPTTAGQQPIISIRSGHVVTVAANVQANRTTVASGGTLTIAPGTAMEFINSSSGGADLLVNGTLAVPAGAVLLMGRLGGANGYTGASSTGGFLTVSTGATFTADGIVLFNTGSTATSLAAGTTTFRAGSRVILFGTTTTPVVPVATWEPTATLELGGTNSTSFNYSASFAGKTFGNVDVTMTGTGTPILLTTTGTATIAGNLTVSRGSTTNLLRLISAGTTAALTIGGNYVQNSGGVTGYVSNTTTGNGATPGVSVGGSFALLGGTYTANQAASSTLSTIRPTPLAVAGSLGVSSGATFYLVSNVLPTTNYTSVVTLGGDFTNAGAFSTLSTQAANTNQQLYFTKAGVQSFTNTGTIGNGTTNRVNVTVNSGSVLDLGTSALTGAGTFTTLAGATLRLGSPAGLSASGTATGNVQSTGTRTLGGNFELNGTTAQSTGTGFPATVATTLTFNNAAGVTLAKALAVTGTLSLRQGVVTTTAANLLTLGSSGSTLGTLDPVATNTGYVQGPLRRWVAATTGATAFAVGAATVVRPASIGYTAAPTAAGTLTAEFVASPAGSQGLPLAENGNTATKSATDGYWRFTAADGLVDGTYTATFTFNGLTGAADYTKLLLLKRANAAADWALLGSPVANGGTNTAPVLSRAGLAGFSDFTAGLTDAPLPVTLTAFTAVAQGTAAVRLGWATASERNSARFEVERSLDGVRFAKIGTVAAAGTTAAARTYALTDVALPAGAATLYYRLRQVDLDGTATYSPVRVVALAGAGLVLFPNPAHQAATLTGAAPGQAVQVLDALGRLVCAAPADASGTAALALPAGLPGGVYVVRAGTQAVRLTVE